MNWLKLIVSLTMLTPAAARAEWFEVSSDHFVVYTDDSERDVRRFSDRLERYHNAVTGRLRIQNKPPSPSNRVTVFVVKNEAEVRKIGGFAQNSFVSGFYSPRAGGSVAFVYSIDSSGANATESELVLLHEYAHHIMHSNSGFSYPRWMSEGFAEFYANARFEKDGAVGLGLPAESRSHEIAYAKDVPVKLLVDSAGYAEFAKKSREYDNFYGRSWLLYHMMTLDAAHKGQLSNYVTALNDGASEMDAATGAFGDLSKLEKKLESYAERSSLYYVKLTGESLKPGPINIRRLTPGEIAIMPVRMKSKRGVDEEQAKALVVEARDIAARFPQDAAVMSALAEAEYDAGNHSEAIAAADRATAINPKDVNALIQKGYAMAAQAGEAEDRAAAYKAVRRQFAAANAVEPENPIPLIWFYRSYIDNGEAPSINAKKGLDWALALAPFDDGLRWDVAAMHMYDGNYREVVALLQPLVNSPHKSEMTEKAAEKSKQAQAALADKLKQATNAGAPKAASQTTKSTP